MSQRKLLDVNVVLPLMFGDHSHADAATAWLARQEEPRSLLLCRVVQLGTLRLLTNASAMTGQPIEGSDFWPLWDRMLEDARFDFAEEPLLLEQSWRALAKSRVRGCVDNDWYLAAFATAAGCSIVSFDKGFGRFKGLALEFLA